MLKIEKNNTIKLTRGDTARVAVPITNTTTKVKYTLAPEDTLTLTVRKHCLNTDFCLQKKLTGDNVFHIKPEDTADLAFGSYKYDVELTTAAGDVYTVIGPANFELLQEVTY